MTLALDYKPPFDPANVKDFGPATIEHRTAAAGLNQLGTYFMTFHDAALTDPWTVQYEETIYVISGQARVVVIDGDEEQTVLADADELLVLPHGTTVRYGADPGTRLLLSITPVNWRDVSPSA